MIGPVKSPGWLNFTTGTPMHSSALRQSGLQARRQFYARLEILYEREGQGVSYDAFRLEMVKFCKEYFKKN